MKANEQNRNYMRNQKNKLRIRQEEIEISLKKKGENREKREEKYGKYPELIKLGEVDRIGGHIPKQIDDAEMKISYEYGFFQRGSRVLAGEFEKGTYSNEEQRNFGISDLINGVDDSALANLSDYPNYMNGRIFQMGVKIYDYITENNITIDEYIYLMSMFNTNVTNPEFKNGYNYQVEMKNRKTR